LALTNGGTGASDAVTARTNLGLGSLSTLNTVNDSNWSGVDLSIANGGTGSSTAATARTALGVAIGTDVQAFDAQLNDVAGLAVTDGNFIVANGVNWVAESGATARTSLGLGSLAVLSTINNSSWSGTDLAIVNGGTGASDAATARTNLAAAANTLSGVNFSGLTALTAPNMATTDGFLIDDAGVSKRMEYSSSGIKVLTVSATTDTLATADMNTFIEYTAATAVTVTLNIGVGTVGNVIIIKQTGAGQVTVSGTATLESAIGNNTRVQNSVITLVCIAVDVWALYGDQA